MATHINDCDRQALIEVIISLRAWYDFQSSINTIDLYNAASKLFKSKFNPTDYDEVE